MTRATSPHECPHCHCSWDAIDHVGTIDKTAPFYSLVMLIEEATRQTRNDKLKPRRLAVVRGAA